MHEIEMICENYNKIIMLRYFKTIKKIRLKLI